MFSYPSVLTYVLFAIETVLLNTHNIIFWYTLLSKGLNVNTIYSWKMTNDGHNDFSYGHCHIMVSSLLATLTKCYLT